MKTLTKFSIVTFSLLLTLTTALAQEKEPTMFVVHVDHVNFAKMPQYEQLAATLKTKCEEYKVETGWTSIAAEDGKYYYVSPIKNMAELDENPMATLFDKMGDDAAKLFSSMDECYDAHGNYIVHHNKDLSYTPEGYSTEDKLKREYHFLYYSPRNAKAMKEAMTGVKKVFESKGIKNGYNIYHSGFGIQEAYYLVVVAGSSELSMATNGEENNKVLGDDGKAAFFEVIKLASKYDQVEGDIRPDLSYTPNK